MIKQPPPPLNDVTSYKLSRVPREDTALEIWVQKHLSGLGIRYGKRNRDLQGSPDLANRKRKWPFSSMDVFGIITKDVRRKQLQETIENFG
jgi:G:T-mismatch repair DNA endonuclease (very short patch repair protein)